MVTITNQSNFMDKNKKHDQPISQPDPETLHTTDPQEEMEGPVSSLMNKAREKMEESDTDASGETKKEKKEKEEKK
jgi:hypothetical protein